MISIALGGPARQPVLAELAGRGRVKDLALIVGGAAWVAALGQVSIPLGFTPVPITLGTFAVLTAGAALGWRRAGAAMVLFLAAGLAGLPVFAGGQSGVGLPTMGYAIGYVLAAALAGRAAERGLDRSWWRWFAVMALGELAIYLIGVPYLAAVAGLSLPAAIAQGLAPFLIGDLVKAGAAAAALPSAWLAIGTRTGACRTAGGRRGIGGPRDGGGRRGTGGPRDGGPRDGGGRGDAG
ncbi:MAG: biotin transporter BioY [Bifidobacteriaceae bacterium]|jgi:biotin transport system substrate-specific component|nr:biotin transporter BioY [Bifidobacteriaceae bacterium]